MKKMQKVLMLVLILSFSTVVFASTTGYRLDDIGMTILIPDDYFVFTRDMKANDPGLKQIGMSKDEFVNQMIDKNIYLTAMDKNFAFEINVIMTSSSFPDFDTVDDATLSSLTSALKSTFEKAGYTVSRYMFYNHAQAKFIRMYYKTTEYGQTTYFSQYYTTLDKMAINVTMRSYDGPIVGTRDSLLESIVKGISFYNHVSQKETEAYTYSYSIKQTEPDRNSVDDLLAQYTFGNIIISLIVTILIYTVPIVIYRYAIKKRPVSTKAGTWITIIYALVAIFVMAMIKSAINGKGTVGGAIIFWSFINYRILTRETEKDKEKNKEIEEATNDRVPFYKAEKSTELETHNQPISYIEGYHPQTNENSVFVVDEIPQVYSNQERNDNSNGQASSESYQPIIFYSTSTTDGKRGENIGGFCQECGAAISSDSMFCRKCGARIKWE